MKRKKIFLIEDSPIIVKGFSAFLENHPNFEMVGFSSDMVHVVEKITISHPDVIVLNPKFVEFSIRTSAHSLLQNFSDIPMVALVHTYYEQALLKQFNAIIEIEDDWKKIEFILRETCQSQNESEDVSDTSDLTEREKAVLIAVAKGMMNKEIAGSLNISIHTVISHRKNIIRKTGIKSVAGLTVYALLNNMIDETMLQY